MLRLLIHELEQARIPMSLNELSRKLGIEQSALQGMIEHLVRTGRVHDDLAQSPTQTLTQSPTTCLPTNSRTSAYCASCAGVQGCPFVTRLPRTLTVAKFTPRTSPYEDDRLHEPDQREPPPFTVSLSVPGMHCAHCEARISQLLRVVPGVTKVHADAHHKRVRVELKHGLSSSSDVNSLIAALAKGGYDAMVEQ